LTNLERGICHASQSGTQKARDLKRLYGERAVVTGASSGLGEAFAHALAARGIRCVLVARRGDELARVAEEVERRYGIGCEILPADVGRSTFPDELSAVCDGKDIGIVISNAADNPAGAFRRHTRDTVERVLDVNVRAALLLANDWLPRLCERGRGAFLLVGSAEGYTGVPYSAVYSSTKAFVLAFGEALWGEYRKDGVDVLVLVPGAIDTPLLASRQIRNKGMDPRVVADIGLDHLGRGPAVVPGSVNRWIFAALRHLPRRWTVRLVGAAMRPIVEKVQR
jgi:short-subunit dehydrogenase